MAKCLVIDFARSLLLSALAYDFTDDKLVISVFNYWISLYISIINFKKELCRRTLIYIGPITWNKLDNILKNISNYKLFRKRMYTNLLSSYSVYL